MKQIIQTYLQYSKRIAIFGIVQWAVISVLAIIIASLHTFLPVSANETTADLLKTIVTSSSTVAITISGGYFAHSAYDNKLKQTIPASSSAETAQETTSNG